MECALLSGLFVLPCGGGPHIVQASGHGGGGDSDGGGFHGGGGDRGGWHGDRGWGGCWWPWGWQR